MSKRKLFRSVVALVTGLLLLFSTMTVGFAATTTNTNPTVIYATAADGKTLAFNFTDLLNAYVTGNTAYIAQWTGVKSIDVVVVNGVNVDYAAFLADFIANKVDSLAAYAAQAGAKTLPLPITAVAVKADGTLGTSSVLVPLSVASVSAINLTQLQVVYSKAVEKASATNLANYTLVQGTSTVALSTTNVAAITLQADGKTIVITLKGASALLRNQLNDKLVISGVRSADFTERVTDSTTQFAVLDMTAPTVASVTAKGLRGIEVKFSEDVQNATSSPNYQLNGKSLSAYAVGAIAYDPETYTATIPFGIDLPVGDNVLTVSYGNSLSDYAGLKVVENKVTYSIAMDTTVPTVQNVEVVKNPVGLSAGRYIKVTFTKPLATDGLVVGTARNSNLTAASFLLVDGTAANAWVSAGALYLATTTDTLKAGLHVVRINQEGTTTASTSDDKYVVDAYGVKVLNNTTVTYSVDVDTVAPTVTNVAVKGATTIEVTFNEDVSSTSQVKANYVLKDADGNVVSIQTITQNPDSLGLNVVRLTTTNNMTSASYTLAISGVKDDAGNKMADYSTTFGVADLVAPTLSSATVSSDGLTVYVIFSEAIDATALTTKANYNINGKALPSLATVTADQGNKVAKIALPSTHTLGTIAGGTVTVANMLDVAGNKMAGLYAQVTINSLSTVAIKPFSTGENVRVKDANTLQLQFAKELAQLDVTDFAVTYGGSTYTPLATSTFVNKTGYSVVTLKLQNSMLTAAGKTSVTSIGLQIFGTATTKAYDGSKLTPVVSVSSISEYIAPSLYGATAALSSGQLTITGTFTEAGMSLVKSDFVVNNNGNTYMDGDGYLTITASGDTLIAQFSAAGSRALDYTQPIYLATREALVSTDAAGNCVTADTTGIAVDTLTTAMTDAKSAAILTTTTLYDNVTTVATGGTLTVSLGSVTTATSYLATGESLGVMVKFVPATGTATTVFTTIDKADTGSKTLNAFSVTPVTGDKVQVKFVDLAGGYDSGWFTVKTY